MSEWPVWLRFALAVLATWRVVRLIAHEDGPFDVVVRVRRRLGDGEVGQLMDCPYCASFWVAAPFAFCVSTLRDPAALAVAWIAISGGASLLEQIGARSAPATGS